MVKATPIRKLAKFLPGMRSHNIFLKNREDNRIYEKKYLSKKKIRYQYLDATIKQINNHNIDIYLH